MLSFLKCIENNFYFTFSGFLKAQFEVRGYVNESIFLRRSQTAKDCHVGVTQLYYYMYEEHCKIIGKMCQIHKKLDNGYEIVTIISSNRCRIFKMIF